MGRGRREKEREEGEGEESWGEGKAVRDGKKEEGIYKSLRGEIFGWGEGEEEGEGRDGKRGGVGRGKVGERGETGEGREERRRRYISLLSGEILGLWEEGERRG